MEVKYEPTNDVSSSARRLSITRSAAPSGVIAELAAAVGISIPKRVAKVSIMQMSVFFMIPSP